MWNLPEAVIGLRKVMLKILVACRKLVGDLPVRATPICLHVCLGQIGSEPHRIAAGRDVYNLLH